MINLARRISDHIIRRKVALHKTTLDRYQVRIARTVDEHEDARRLVHAAYVYQGIESVRASELRASTQKFGPHTTVLVAYEGDQLVGTMSVVADSAVGLPLDKDCANELATLRQQGARLVEYSSYAIVERCWSEGVSNLLYIAANCITCGKDSGPAASASASSATHVVIGVHPRATNFYRAVFNFRVLTDTRWHTTLQAPVIGLAQDISELEGFLHRGYRKPMASGRLPVEHFFGGPLVCIDLARRPSGRASIVQASLASLRSSPSGSPASRGPSEGSGPAASERQVVRVTPVASEQKGQLAC